VAMALADEINAVIARTGTLNACSLHARGNAGHRLVVAPGLS
jgi:hypothetical protein